MRAPASGPWHRPAAGDAGAGGWRRSGGGRRSSGWRQIVAYAKQLFSVANITRPGTQECDGGSITVLFEAPPGVLRLWRRAADAVAPEQDGQAAGQPFNSILYYAVDDIQQTARAGSPRRRLRAGAASRGGPAACPAVDGVVRDMDRNLLAIMRQEPPA